MNDEIEVKEKILIKAEEKFHQFGFSKVTMEEIAADLGISKKTLYKYFSNKEHILKEILDHNKCEFITFVEELFNNDPSEFLEKLKKLMDYVVKNSPRFHGPLFQELMKNHPQIWKEIEDFRHKKAYNQISMLLNKGIKEGIFRNDIQSEVVTIVYMSAIHGLIDPDTLAELPISSDQIHKIVMQIILEGILSENGRNKYQTQNVFNDNNGDTTK